MIDLPDPYCVKCHRSPKHILEYIEAAEDDKTDPISYLRREEGTYNPSNGHFWCTTCYVKVGTPLGVAP